MVLKNFQIVLIGIILFLFSCKDNKNVSLPAKLIDDNRIDFSDIIGLSVPDSLFNTEMKVKMIPKRLMSNPLEGMEFRLTVAPARFPKASMWLRKVHGYYECGFIQAGQSDSGSYYYRVGLKPYWEKKRKNADTSVIEVENEQGEMLKFRGYFLLWSNSGYSAQDKIDGTTTYLESNLPDTLLRRAFPGIKCTIAHHRLIPDAMNIDCSFITDFYKIRNKDNRVVRNEKEWAVKPKIINWPK